MSPPLQPAWVAPPRTALLIVDMQVDFALPEGACGRGGVDLSRVPSALANAERLAAAARAAGVPVIFVGLSTRPETDPPAWRTWMQRRGRDPEQEFGLCRAGSPGADFVGAAPQPGETIVLKQGYSGFFNTDLHARLGELGRDTLVVCGLTTDCCVDQTVRDGFHLGYQMFVVADACAAYEQSLHEHALDGLASNYAIAAATNNIIGAWA